MKIQLDYTNKTLSLENGVNMGEFFKRIKVILPDWKEWELKTNTVINNFSRPMIIEKHYQRPWWEWQSQPLVTYCKGTAENKTSLLPESALTFSNGTGLVNIELQ